jgi:MoaA/NifB/PqqE/SkfB family radical SAM enzyme
MSVETYEQILSKIEREHPGEKVSIDLYNWGEPVLHKNLAKIITLTKSRGMPVGVSTNLNSFPNMREVLRAAPSHIRISLSGYTNGTYQQTHRGGDINVVKSNMYLLRHWLNETDSDTLVQVGYHLYKDNIGTDFDNMRRLCHELDFVFEPFLARMYPLEKMIDAMAGIIAPEDRAINDQFAVSMSKSRTEKEAE